MRSTKVTVNAPVNSLEASLILVFLARVESVNWILPCTKACTKAEEGQTHVP
jgi:hypothetical protein